ncbi:MAM and LDL-receptor class A domain-containing protein 1 isoform X2 [Pygocentrus nattereri]|uniref:MAM and LDL-receptor class A domain-containing protein 1 isoform X2 n=1 Tax=Pygocentrus nattereri TaxID=42514 RepID=UPI001890E82B|nr:MAM and LDL-receptor class A domain-containing protein 1 isoform X2 [Pygocentrus nattereri]
MARLLFLLFVALELAYYCDGQFQSAFQNHASLKKANCTDGSDEAFCGSCDFEKDTCGWNDTSNGAFRWRLEMANISSIPGVDHTTGSPWGQVMHVDGEDPAMFSKAILERTFIQSTAVGCQISFWYHLHDPIGLSSHFALSMVTNGSSLVLWEIKKGQTDGWVNASVRLGNRPEGFKLVFSVDPTHIGNQDVMLDDVRLTGCAEGDVPAGSEQLSCDFEKDLCGWYPDQSASLNWERANGQKPSLDNQGPGYDHTTGSGYYIYIAPKRSSNPSQTARLVSYPQQGKCISFWYHIYGGSIGSLRFISKNTEGSETVVWMRTGTQGNKWHFVQLSFDTTDNPVQFIFEGILGGTDGSIAVDDVQVWSSVNGSCLDKRECTFQSGLCGLQPEPAAHFPWVRTTGQQAVGSANPPTDHTLGTDQGYYLSAQLWKHPLGSRGSMLTQVNEPTAENGQCWMFWYHMAGRDNSSLSVYLQQSHNSSTRVLLWSRSIEQGELWRHSKATVLSPHSTYQVIFEAVVGDGQVKDIAIDDLSVLNGPCPPNGLCDFEMDQCGWVSSALSVHSVAWSWTSGTSAFGFAPEVDHTTNSALGHYMAFDTKYTSEEQIAYLQSELMQPVDHACLEFWYYMNMWGTVDKLTLTVFVNESGKLHFLWNQTGVQGKVWNKVTLDYAASKNYQLVFEAKRPPYDEGVIALDDIHIRENTGCSDLIPTTPAPTTEPTTPPPSSMDCSFEEGLCDWVQEAEHGFAWTRQRGLQVDTTAKGPFYDHTIKNSNGFYLLLNMSGDKDSKTAAISVPVTMQATSVCVEFWYYMLGTSVGNLDLLVKTKTAETVVWTRTGTEAAEWLKTQVTISIDDTQRVKISGSRKTKSSGFIAIDDVRVSPGACVDHNPCGFEDSSLCGFEKDVSDSTHWLHMNGSTGHIDHTYRTQLGHSMAVLGSELLKPETTHLLTPEYSRTTESCLQFWYWLAAGPKDSLTVHVYLNGELGPALWSLSGAPSTGWDLAEVTVSSPSKFRVAFRTELSPAQESFILLDDVSVRDGTCFPTGSCDFESGLCMWMNAANRSSDSHDWVHSDGHSLGPRVDQTTHTAYGRFMLNPSQTGGPGQGSRAVLISERILQNSNSCFSFWYHMNDSDSGTLRAFLDAEKGRELMFETSAAGHSWRNFSTTVSETNPFQILLEAESGNGGFIAVDDITVMKGQCEDVAEVSGVFVGCQFETDSCAWKDVSVGQFAWQRDRNGTTTANTGPSVDHTTGTELGWYMAVEASRGDQNSYAALQSQPMKEASTECVLEFYYHMYGEGIGELKVFLQEDSRRTLLWWKSGDHGDEWRQAEVAVGRTHQVFTVLFEATRTFSELGDIAIDDITFLSCSLPEPQESCPAGTFTCSSNVCVEMSRVCDFRDDCGDGSDEARCEELGYKHRCSFEHGMCSWEINEGGPEWSLERGEWAWPVRGPPRDHTRNTAAGHYIVPVPMHSASQTAEIMSSTLLPSSNCTVSFYLFSHGNNSMGRLSTRLRMVRSGDDDIILWGRSVRREFHWQRAEITFSSTVNTKIVFQFVGSGESYEEFIAVDDVSFSPSCVHDPDNSQLPITPPTAPPSTPTAPQATPTPTEYPCKEDEFHCWRSNGVICIAASAQCDYSIDCPLGEDEETCGPCTFENGICNWMDISQNSNKWQRVKASTNTQPPADHTTGTGHYMQVDFSSGASENEAQFQSPSLPASSPYCQIQFHFHIGRGGSVGDLNVLLQNGEGKTAQLWTRNHSTAAHWSLEHLATGKQQQPYRIVFSSRITSVESTSKPVYRAVALDDISFLNCETSYQPPAVSAAGCSFEKDLCGWVQGSAEDLHWIRKSGPTETANTGPAGDHTSSQGYYVYVESSRPNTKGHVAQLKSPLLPSAGEKGYCLKFWYHMFGATIGSLKLFLQNIDSRKTTLIWQRVGSQGNEWQLVQSHVTLQEVHRILIDASIGGEAGDIAIDDLWFAEGACSPAGGLCDFEKGSCGWMQQADDDLDWIRGSGNDPVLNSKPSFDHTTNTESGYYYYIGSDSPHVPGHSARMSSPLFTTGYGQCLQLWYYMSGQQPGTLNVYQEHSSEDRSLLLSQSGEQGKLWRFAQAPLLNTWSDYRIVVEGIKGQSDEGTMAIDDVQLSSYPCTGPGHCDFEVNMCSWRNVIDGDYTDWLRQQGNSRATSTGPSVDHTTNSSIGYYLYVDSTVGKQGDRALLLSEIFSPDSLGQCFTFWYHIYGHKIGTFNVYVNNRTMHGSGNSLGQLMWTESGNQGDVWLRGRIYIHQKESFWFMLEYQKGKGSIGNVAIDDLHITSGSCEPPPTAAPSDVGIAVGVTLMILMVVIACSVVYVLRRRQSNREPLIENNMLERNVYDLYDCEIQDSQS